MAKEYFQKLSDLIRELKLQDDVGARLEVKHFFSGAALYTDERICASWSPAGLAFKLSDQEATRLIIADEAKPLRYFEGGHVKRGYALFEDPGDRDAEFWRMYFIKAIET